ncbi:HlyD family efflux transporter periplasmic adaptor subunit [Larkinella knui]|uniref:HlyD family efflux transporter periplasmic adaptor subunit n=1 Tax=Larkinella knui TaxID=2025310 RepID=A0A3P1CNQ0_9BACT|nr:HlyD family efflux transporter periplasmic adaptor subunit [Larkinella knui]RRB14963.1 HlyD family efflux transporter periplasmic adaptor subunit [Larkinella knui]
MKNSLIISILSVGLMACETEPQSDAYGNFEAVETVVSAEATGALQTLTVEEGQTLRAGQTVGQIDPLQLQLRKSQLLASRRAVSSRSPNIQAQLSPFEQQIAVQEQQLKTLQREKIRTQNLIAAGAAPTKQLDDIVAQIDVIERQIALIRQQRAAQQSALTTQRSGTLSEEAPLEEQIRQIDDQIKKATIVNPATGTVTVKFAEPGEVASYGKPLYKVADLDRITLRAYISGDQLVRVKTGQKVKVLVDAPNDQFKEYAGTVTWVSSKAEFTPKVIQTKDERVNLVYALKVLVKNDGGLKIGMPGEVKL